MRSLRFILLLAGIGMVAGCDKDVGVITAPKVPLAFTRFVNVVPDTGATDWRFIDRLENSPIGIALPFRGTTPYQATGPGPRELRVFPVTGDLTTQNFLVGQSLALSPETYYTIFHVGYARTGQTPADELLLTTDAIPSVTASQFAIRVVHMGAGLPNVDVYASASGGTAPLPATPSFTNVAFKQPTPYVTLPVGALVLRATANGTVTPVLAEGTAPAGVAGDPANNLTAIGGSTIGGSVITAILVPRSVSGSKAAAFTTPNWVFVIDKHPR